MIRPGLRASGLDTALAMQAWSFTAMGLYFVWFWQRNGQTLAMQTGACAWKPRRANRRAGRRQTALSARRLWLPPSAAVGHALGLVKGPFRPCWPLDCCCG